MKRPTSKQPSSTQPSSNRASSKKLPAEKLQRARLNTLARAPKRITKRDVEQSLAGRILATRRARRLATTAVVAGFVILIGIVLTATFSPLLAIKEIKVTGTNRIDPKLITTALQNFLDRPLPLLREEEVADALADFDLIESFAAISLPPNTLQIRIVEREPICIVKISGQAWLYDPAGVRIAKASADDKLPEIKITEEPRNSLRFKNAIDVLLALPANLLDQIEYLEAKTKDDVEMALRNSKNQRIVWGDSSDSVLKSKVLQALMKNHKNATSITFDVSSPNAPVVRYDNF